MSQGEFSVNKTLTFWTLPQTNLSYNVRRIKRIKGISHFNHLTSFTFIIPKRTGSYICSSLQKYSQKQKRNNCTIKTVNTTRVVFQNYPTVIKRLGNSKEQFNNIWFTTILLLSWFFWMNRLISACLMKSYERAKDFQKIKRLLLKHIYHITWRLRIKQVSHF